MVSTSSTVNTVWQTDSMNRFSPSAQEANRSVIANKRAKSAFVSSAYSCKVGEEYINNGS